MKKRKRLNGLQLAGLLSAFVLNQAIAAGTDSMDSSDSSSSTRNRVTSTRSSVKKKSARVKRTVVVKKKEVEQQPGRVAEDTYQATAQQVTERRVHEVAPPKAIMTERVGIKPQIGALFYQSRGDEGQVRGMLGVTVDWNLANTFRKDYSHWFVGLSSGALASRVGEAGANFVGSGDRSQGNSLLIIPANLKIGYLFNDNFRASVRGGGNLFYRSALSSMAIGTGDTASGASNWRMFPNAGADLEFALGQKTALMIRPDVTFGTVDNVYSASVALSIPLS